MALLKELHTASTETIITEGSVSTEQLRKMFDILDENVEKVGKQLKTDSQLAKRIEKAGGDMKHFASIIKKYDDLYDNVMDLIQYTMSPLNGEDE